MRARSWFVVMLALAAGAPRAQAQSASAQAEALFRRGRQLVAQGKLDEACGAFESSQKLDPAVTTLLNLADCRETNQQLATAWGLFGDANRLARTTSNDKLARIASSHVQKLAPRLSKLTITVAAERNVAGLEVLRGSEVVDPASWNHALPIDGGSYVITARAPGRTTWTATRSIKVEGDLVVVDIPRLAESAPAVAAVRPPASGLSATAKPEPPRPQPAKPEPAKPEPAKPAASAPRPALTSAPAPPPAIATGRTAVEPSPEQPADQPHGGRSLIAPIALGGGAVVLGGVAIAFELKGRRLYNEAKDITDPALAKERDAKVASANGPHKTAQWLGVAALGCAGAAIYLLVSHRGEDHPTATAIAPMLAPELAGLAVTGAW